MSQIISEVDRIISWLYVQLIGLPGIIFYLIVIAVSICSVVYMVKG